MAWCLKAHLFLGETQFGFSKFSSTHQASEPIPPALGEIQHLHVYIIKKELSFIKLSSYFVK